MKTIKMFFMSIACTILLSASTIYGRTDFYSNGTIQNGDSFDNVYTWNNVTVDMIGGQIDSLDTFNFSVINLEGGNIVEGVYVWNDSTLNMYGGSIGWSLEVSDSGTINLLGGLITDYLYATDSSVVNIYGYGFEYNPDAGIRNGGQLTGYWLSGTPFAIDFLDNIEISSTYYDHVNLIPEPATLFLLALGACLLRKRHLS
ncbi:MAG: PEP-CTERM sorting domain-containing protein [Planctomycetota bacterium]